MQYLLYLDSQLQKLLLFHALPAFQILHQLIMDQRCHHTDRHVHTCSHNFIYSPVFESVRNWKHVPPYTFLWFGLCCLLHAMQGGRVQNWRQIDHFSIWQKHVETIPGKVERDHTRASFSQASFRACVRASFAQAQKHLKAVQFEPCENPVQTLLRIAEAKAGEISAKLVRASSGELIAKLTAHRLPLWSYKMNNACSAFMEVLDTAPYSFCLNTSKLPHVNTIQ